MNFWDFLCPLEDMSGVVGLAKGLTKDLAVWGLSSFCWLRLFNLGLVWMSIALATAGLGLVLFCLFIYIYIYIYVFVSLGRACCPTEAKPLF